MFKRNRDKEIYDIVPTTIIAKGVTADAAVFKGDPEMIMRVDGQINGKIDSNGSLQIGETGVIIGDISIGRALIAGRVQGNLFCRGLLHLTPSAVVDGDITTEKMIVEEGAHFRGKISVGKEETYVFSSKDGAKKLVEEWDKESKA